MTSSTRATFHAWTPKVSLQVQGSRDTFVYVSATRGFKSGGFNPAAREPGRGLQPEFAWSYEGGLKRHDGRRAGPREHGGVLQRLSGPAGAVVPPTRRARHQQRRIGDHQGHRSRNGCGDVARRAARRGTSPGSTRRTTDYLALLPGGRPLDATGNRLNNARAVKSGPDLAETQTALGTVNYWLEWNWPAAETAFRKAIDFDYSYSQAHRVLGIVLASSGRHEAARLAMSRARELDPSSPVEQALSAARRSSSVATTLQGFPSH